MNQAKLKRLLNQDEGFKLDFKQKLCIAYESEKKELAKDVIAIANTEGGRGYIVFGIEDKTKHIIGIEPLPEDIEERLQHIIARRSMPPVPIALHQLVVNCKRVAVLTIFKSRQIPHQMLQNGAFYIRRGSTTDTATRHELAKMLQYAGMLVFEMVPCHHGTLEDLDFEQIKKVFKTQDYEVCLNLLMALGVIIFKQHDKSYRPTYGGLLIFGKRPQKELPQATLEIRYKGTIHLIEGNISCMLETFEEWVVQQGAKDYPIEALKEVVANALIHRDYWHTNYYTNVTLEDHKIEVSNPYCYGFAQVKNNAMRNNGWLYSRLLLVETQENKKHFGIGLEKARYLLKDHGILSVHVDETLGLFTVTLPGLK